MPLYEVEKVVAVCLLEASKLVLQQLGRFRMDLAERGLDAPETLSATYGTVRRLRDFFQRSIGAFPEGVELELADEDANIVVSCAARSIEVIDHELATTRLSTQDEDWLNQKRGILIDWAVEFATRPLEDLPGPKPHATPSKGLSLLKTRVHSKLRDMGVVHGGAANMGLANPAAPRGFQASFGNPFGKGEVGAKPEPAPKAAAATGPIGAEVPPPIGVGFASMECSEVVIENRVLDPRAVRDPRLRPLMAMDLKAFERALEVRDHRLAMVHLGSIVENATLDHCLPRRSELQLQGAPETWDMREVIETHVPMESAARDRSVLYQLLSAQHLIRPARQITSPMVVTAASLEYTLGYVRRLLKEMGFAQGAALAGPGNL